MSFTKMPSLIGELCSQYYVKKFFFIPNPQIESIDLKFLCFNYSL